MRGGPRLTRVRTGYGSAHERSVVKGVQYPAACLGRSKAIHRVVLYFLTQTVRANDRTAESYELFAANFNTPTTVTYRLKCLLPMKPLHSHTEIPLCDQPSCTYRCI